MTQHGKKILGITVGAIALIMVTAGASAFLTDHYNNKETTTVTTAPATHVATTTTTHRSNNIHWNNPPAQPARPVQQVSAPCSDGNVVGYGLGALAGGLVGHQLGGGKGKTVATVGGAAAGALAGGQYIPTRNVLCNR